MANKFGQNSKMAKFVPRGGGVVIVDAAPSFYILLLEFLRGITYNFNY